MKRTVLILLLLTAKAYAGDLVFKISVPDTSILKQNEIKLTAQTDSSHTYDMGAWVKKDDYVKAVANRDSLQSKLIQIVQFINPEFIQAYQIVLNPELRIIKKSEYETLTKTKKKEKK